MCHVTPFAGVCNRFDFVISDAKEYDHNNWPGKMCCNLAQSNRCSQACITANSIKNVQSDCHYKSEIDFYQCSYHRQVRIYF